MMQVPLAAQQSSGAQRQASRPPRQRPHPRSSESTKGASKPLDGMEYPTIVTRSGEDTTDLTIQQRGQPTSQIAEWRTQTLAGCPVTGYAENSALFMP